MSIPTPEGLELDLVLAGAGSRVAAGLLDMLLKALVLVAASVAAAVASAGEAAFVILALLAAFLVWFGYDVLFEVFQAGRTPGKRWTGLRVVTIDGAAVGVGPSVVRNLLRIVDFLPSGYLVGILTVVLTSRNQRVGDVVAGTLVVRETRELGSSRVELVADSRMADELAGWDVTAVTSHEVSTVRRFLERRPTLDPAARQRLAVELASRLRPKVVSPERDVPPERFLEELVAAKSLRGQA